MTTLRALTATFILSLACLSANAALTPYTDAARQAKDENKYMVLIWNGSDWSPEANAVTRQFDAFAAGQDLPVIWCEWDEREHITEEEEQTEFFKKNAPPARVWNIPAILILSPDNQPVFKLEGVHPEQFPKIAAAFPSIIANQKKADAFWQNADKEKGEAAALLYSKGLALLPSNIAKERKDILNKAKKADPDDKTGTRFKVEFSHSPIMKGLTPFIWEKGKEKDYEGAEKFVKELLSINGLSKDQRQKIMGAYFGIAKAKKDKKEMLTRLQNIVKFDPKSEMGRGAAYYYDYLTKPVIMKGNTFSDYEMRPDFMPLVMDATPYVKSAGKYKVSINFFRDKCEFRNPRFISGGRTIAGTPAGMKDKNETEFVFDIPASPSNLQLIIEAKGKGWFKARGEINITKM